MVEAHFPAYRHSGYEGQLTRDMFDALASDAMRETLDISDDVLQAAKERARRENWRKPPGPGYFGTGAQRVDRTPGRGRKQIPRRAFGFHPFPKRGGIVTNEIIDSLREDESQEALALLELLALGNRQIEAGDVVPATGAVQRLLKKSRK